jgi:lipopolysaccharide/colanic/teichoic acid biosynthesis glycosyltransferase
MLYRRYFKYFFDFIIALLGLIFLSPIFVILWIILLITNKGAGAFFIQQRTGLHGVPFKLFKFKSMTDEKDENGKLLPDDKRLTTTGEFIRRFKIDELPQLINILKGDMSFVGPRPGLISMLNELNEDGKARLKVRPGLTGLAQINGNIYLSWEERWIYDKKYVENISFLLDLKILCKTFLIIIFGEKKFLKNNGTEL